MKLAKWLLFFVFGIQVLAAFVPFIPFFAHSLPENPSPRALLDLQITIFGVQFAIITAYLGLALWLYEKEAGARAASLLAAINAPQIKRLREHDFYPEFLTSIKRATIRVDTMYLAQSAPDETRHPARLHYYDELLRTIGQMPRVRFRRIIRDSENNRRWLSRLLFALANNCPNADIGLLKEAGRQEMPLSLSVQLIDSTQVWLVALDTHEGSSEYRDVYVESAEFNAAMNGYYERLWDRSEPLLKQGRLTAEGQQIIDTFSDGET